MALFFRGRILGLQFSDFPLQIKKLTESWGIVHQVCPMEVGQMPRDLHLRQFGVEIEDLRQRGSRFGRRKMEWKEECREGASHKETFNKKREYP